MIRRRKTIHVAFQEAAESLAQADHVAMFHHWRNAGTVLDPAEKFRIARRVPRWVKRSTKGNTWGRRRKVTLPHISVLED